MENNKLLLKKIWKLNHKIRMAYLKLLEKKC